MLEQSCPASENRSWLSNLPSKPAKKSHSFKSRPNVHHTKTPQPRICRKNIGCPHLSIWLPHVQVVLCVLNGRSQPYSKISSMAVSTKYSQTSSPQISERLLAQFLGVGILSPATSFFFAPRRESGTQNHGNASCCSFRCRVSCELSLISSSESPQVPCYTC